MRLKPLDRFRSRGFCGPMVAPKNTSPVRIRLFRNDGLELLTVISAPIFGLLWAILLPLIAVLGAHIAATPWAFALLAAGLIVWTATEYVLHRFVFHLEARSPFLRRIVFVIHGNHHDNPNDPLRNLMPPIVSLPVGGVIWMISCWLLGPAGTWLFLGFMVGYVGYDLVHYACHQWPMKSRIGRMLKTHHMRHHHLPDRGNYAITGMIWDRIFATRISTAKERA